MIIGKSLTALGGGGLKPEIHVTAEAGALLNLHYKDSSIILQSYQLRAEETQHTFVVSVSETAYVVEDVTNSASVEVLVDTVCQYTVRVSDRTYIIKDGSIIDGYSPSRRDNNYDSGCYGSISYNPLVISRKGASWTRLYFAVDLGTYKSAHTTFSNFTYNSPYNGYSIGTSPSNSSDGTGRGGFILDSSMVDTEYIVDLSDISEQYIWIGTDSSTVGSNSSITFKDFWLE